MSNDKRFKQGQIATILGIALNVFLAIIKAFGGIVGNSRALIADAVHSASDIVSSIAVLVGLRAAQKPPDSEHPYGHGKAENIAALIVSILLVVIGFEILTGAIQAIWTEQESEPTMLALYIVILSIVLKEALYQYKNRLGKRINSPALIADAWHHRSDAISSLVALAGIGLAIVGNQMGFANLQYFDPIASAVIAIIIMYMGYKIGKEAVSVSLESVLAPDEAATFYETVEKVKGVKRIDTLLARSHGSYVIIDTKISVDPTITVDEGHDIAAVVKEQLIEQHEEVMDVYVHVNPYH